MQNCDAALIVCETFDIEYEAIPVLGSYLKVCILCAFINDR